MDKKYIQEAIQKAKANSPKRKFKQTVDLIVVLQGLDLKKTEQQVNNFVNIPHSAGKKISVCALVGAELRTQAKEVCEQVISEDEFGKYQKKEAKKLANKHDYFIAQATIMPQIATAFGKVLGPKGKMPNPKAGCVVPPNANLKPLHERLQKLVRVQTKNQAVIQCRVGIEDQKDEEITDNVMAIYDHLIHHLPNGENNIGEILIKLTMGPACKAGAAK